MSGPTTRSNTTQLIFTRDFHELTRGHLEPGRCCVISYDPARIVPPGDDYRFGDTRRPITAYVRFHPDGKEAMFDLLSWSGALDYAPTSVTGDGAMLKGTFEVSPTTESFEVWFSFTDNSGQRNYDSEFGKNYVFRYIDEDIDLQSASVETVAESSTAYFRCRVLADQEVDLVIARYRHLNGSTPNIEVEAVLQRTPELDEHGCVYWELSETIVPAMAVLAFDLIYLVKGSRFKNDNQGRYFVAGEPELMQAAVSY